MKKLSILILCLLLFTLHVVAQEEPPPEDPTTAAARALNVYVTTQDRSSFRRGPGTSFERMSVLPPAVTMPAIGRTADGRWLQVEYEGQRGWIHSSLLVWSGDMIALPIDGIDPEPFVRRVGILATTTRETPIYLRGISEETYVGVIPEGTQVEVTARLGSSRFMQFQILHQGQLYWVGSWNLRIRDPNWMRLIDTSYLYPFGRLIGRIDRSLNTATTSLSEIENIWVSLDIGQRVSCNYIPRQVDRGRVLETDVRQEPVFGPLVIAFDIAIESTNAAILAFADACGRPPNEFYINEEEIQQALDDIAAARRNFNLARSLLESLKRRDPFRNNGQEYESSF